MSNWRSKQQAAEEGECFDDSPSKSKSGSSMTSSSTHVPATRPSWNDPDPRNSYRGRGGGGRGGIIGGGRGGIGTNIGDQRSHRPFDRNRSSDYSSTSGGGVGMDGPPPPLPRSYSRSRSNDSWGNNNGGGGRGTFRGRGSGRGGRGGRSWSHNSMVYNRDRDSSYGGGGNFRSKPYWQRAQSGGNIGTTGPNYHSNRSGNPSSSRPTGERMGSTPSFVERKELDNRHVDDASTTNTPIRQQSLPSFSIMGASKSSKEFVCNSATTSSPFETPENTLSSSVVASNSSSTRDVRFTKADGSTSRFGPKASPNIIGNVSSAPKTFIPNNERSLSFLRKSAISSTSTPDSSVEKSTKAPPPSEHVFTCSSLKSDEDSKKAKEIVQKLHKHLKDKDNETESSGNDDLELPKTGTILKCIQLMEARMKSCTETSEKLESGIDLAKNRLEKVEKQLRKETEKLHKEAELEIKKRLAEEAAAKAKAEALAKAEAKAKEKKALKEEKLRKETCCAAVTPGIDEIERNDPCIDKTSYENRHFPILSGKAAYRSLIDEVLDENRRRANESHYQTKLALLPPLSREKQRDFKKKLNDAKRIVDDSNCDRTQISFSNDEYTELTRQVTGPANPLYTSPDQAPYYHANEESFEERRVEVTKIVRSKKKILMDRWLKLAYQYASKLHVYESTRENKSNQSQEKDRQRTNSITGRSFSIISNSNECNLTESNEKSGQNAQIQHVNPYRRPRSVFFT